MQHVYPPPPDETHRDANGKVVGMTLYEIYGDWRPRLFWCTRCQQWVEVEKREQECQPNLSKPKS